MWADNKKHFIDAFGGELIYEYPEKVSFEIDEKTKDSRFEDFCFLASQHGYYDLMYYLRAEKEGFFANKVVEEYPVGSAVITKGTKLVRTFKHFIQDKKQLQKFQEEASRIIQENKIEGRLCFSVHPLDYLSISENTYNWRSCHALDGEYRAGNLSYMMDACTVVCYLKGEDNVKLPNFPDSVPWNSKKWRVLLYISKDWKMIFAGKQYPFSSDSGMQLLLDKCLNKKMFNHPNNHPWDSVDKTAFWSKWNGLNAIKIHQEIADNMYIDYDYDNVYVPLTNRLIKLNTLVKDVKGSKHYNDVLKSSCYDPIYTYAVGRLPWSSCEYYSYASDDSRFEVGAYTYCLRCGKEEVVDSASTMMCYDCELKYGVSENDDFGFCAECGRRVEVDTAYYMDDELYCNECFQELTVACEYCGDRIWYRDARYNEKEDLYYCEHCYQR